MVQSVELLMDDDTDALIRRHWTALEQAGIANSGRHHEASNRPHITVAVTHGVIDENPVAASAMEIALPLPAQLGGLLLFGGRRGYVLSRAVVMNQQLLDAQRKLSLAVGPDQPATTRPGGWTPHVTIARRLPAPDVATAIAVITALQPLTDPDRTSTVVAIRRWDGQLRREWRLR